MTMDEERGMKEWDVSDEGPIRMFGVCYMVDR